MKYVKQRMSIRSGNARYSRMCGRIVFLSGTLAR